MPVRSPARPRRAVSVTSLIDVIFLLLLFFMLSSTFTKFAEIRLDTGTGGPAAPAPAATPPLFLQLDADTIRLNAQEVSLEDLPDRLTAEAPDDTETTSRTLIVAPSGDDLTSQRLIDLLVVLRQQPGFDIRVLE